MDSNSVCNHTSDNNAAAQRDSDLFITIKEEEPSYETEERENLH